MRYAVTAAPEAPDGLTRLDVRGAHADYWGLELCAPRYQAANVASAVAAAEAFLGRALDPERVRETVARMRFPGRFEVVERDPWVVADAAHNPQAATALAEAVRDAWPDPAGRPVVVLGVLADKDAAGIATALAPVAAGFVCVAPRSPRALSASELAATVERVTGEAPEVADSTALGIALARSAGKQAVLTTGSVRMAAEAGNPVGR